MLKTMHAVRFQPRRFFVAVTGSACSCCCSLAGESSRMVIELDPDERRGVFSVAVAVGETVTELMELSSPWWRVSRRDIALVFNCDS